MVNEQLENSVGFVTRVDYVCAALENDIGKRPFVGFLGGNIVAGDPFIRTENGIDVDTSELIAELDAHAAKYKGPSKDLCAHFVLSLATGENLPRKDLLESARHYMSVMGYGKGSKWFATVHYDTDNVHVHIVACRAQMKHSDISPDGRPRPPQFSIVKESNSYEKGWLACRELEKKFNLQVVANPDQCFAKNGDIFRNGKDQAKIIRGIMGDVWKQGIPKTFSDLVVRLDEKGVNIKIVTDKRDPNLIQGIAFKLNRPDGKWISGSKLKGTRFTFDQLILKEGIDYNPSRDNGLLGLSPGAYTLVKKAPSAPKIYASAGDHSALMRVYVKIPDNNKRIASYIKNKGRMYGKYVDHSGTYLGLNARVNVNLRKKSKAEVEAEIETERVAKLMASIMKIMRNALNDLFYDMLLKVEMADSENGLTDTALRLTVPVTVDADTSFEQYSEMEDAIDTQVEKQMSFLHSVLSNTEESRLELALS